MLDVSQLLGGSHCGVRGPRLNAIADRQHFHSKVSEISTLGEMCWIVTPAGQFQGALMRVRFSAVSDG
jgi:hypothetical protein